MKKTASDKSAGGEETRREMVRDVLVGMLLPSPINRRIREDERFKETMASVAQVGVQYPILARSIPGNELLEIVDGERRWLICKRLGLATVPTIVRQMSDLEAHLATITALWHRVEASPLEQALMIAQLLQDGMNVDQVATQLGLSRPTITRRVKISGALPEWIAAFKGEDKAFDLSAWSASHMEQIARMPASTQRAVLEKLREGRMPYAAKWGLIELDGFLGDFMRLLRGAPWEMEDAIGGIQPCASCSMRSSCQPDLFCDEGFSIEKVRADDTCLDAECWEKKNAAYLEERREQVEHANPERKVLLVASDPTSGEDDRDIKKTHGEFLQSWQFKKVGRKEPGAQPALIVHGPDRGKAIFVKPTMEEKPGRGAGQPKSLAELKKDLERRRQRRACELLLEMIEGCCDPQTSGKWTGKDVEHVLARAQAVLIGFGCRPAHQIRYAEKMKPLIELDKDGQRDAQDFEAWWVRMRQEGTLKIAQLIVAAAYRTMHDELAEHLKYDVDAAVRTARQICGVWAWNWGAYEAKGIKEIPTPKSWSEREKKQKTRRQEDAGTRRRGDVGIDGKSRAAGEREEAGV